MLSNKPYLIRAFYEWIVDCKCTPLLVVDATLPRCNVPKEYVENGEIILNIAPEAIRDLKIGNSLVEFKASFSGVAHIISAPVRAVLAVYAEENGQGMFFDLENEAEDGDWDDSPMADQGEAGVRTQDSKRPSHLKLVE
ncbi:MAG: ClpXP protease specificity-enhancing factor [Gammaproteobacteria bacterium]|nr:ClpXP protease specificity-enhancing factor [Gammaproteobacteria bacterium]